MKTTLQRSRVAFRILAWLLFVFLVVTTSVAQALPTLWNGQPATIIENAAGGSGLTRNNPILIKDAAELAYFAKQVNAGGILLAVTHGTSIDNTKTSSYDSGFDRYHFALSADINLNGHDWVPIGQFENSFSGHFDGAGHVVKGLKISIQSTTSNYVYAGLFGQVWNGTIRNLGVWLAPEGITASLSQGSIYAGGLVGHMSGWKTFAGIRNCYVESETNGAVSITGTRIKEAYAGGIVGYVSTLFGGSCLLTHCYATVDVEAKMSGSNSNVYAGGITGGGRYTEKVTVSYTYATGKVEGNGTNDVYTGGICGNQDRGTIAYNLALNKSISCTSTGGGEYINRIVGKTNNAILTSNYATSCMKLNGQPVASRGTNNTAGTDIGFDTFETALKSNLSTNNEWTEAWLWTNGLLPKLKKFNINNGVSSGKLAGQVDHSKKDFLTSKALLPIF